MLPWIAHIVGAFGYVGVGVLMALENVVFPIPSELIMPLAAFDAARGPMTLMGVIIAGSIGSVLGALPLYVAARALGEERMTRWIDTHGRWMLLHRRALARADDRFERHGAFAVVISQLIPGARSLISLPAGFSDMHVLVFLAANLAGTVLWCALLALLGHELGTNYGRVEQIAAPTSWALLAVALAAGAIWYARRWRRKRSTN
jgi:membrane protein DedA with SNARE-associated domain